MSDDVGEQRRLRFEALATSAQAMQAALNSYRADLLDGFPDRAAEAVRLEFDESGVLDHVDIDEARRASMTAEQLLTAFQRAFAAAPVPRAVLARLAREPGALRELRSSRELPPAVSVVGDDPRIVLRARLGRPVELRMTPGGVLSTGSAELSAEVVRLARRAAASEGEAA